MKEASGEASNTVITIILIAALLAAATVIITVISQKITETSKEITDKSDTTKTTIENYANQTLK